MKQLSYLFNLNLCCLPRLVLTQATSLFLYHLNFTFSATFWPPSDIWMLVACGRDELQPWATSMHALKLQLNVWRSWKSCTKIAQFALVLQTASKKGFFCIFLLGFRRTKASRGYQVTGSLPVAWRPDPVPCSSSTWRDYGRIDVRKNYSLTK